ncbi:MAG: hypothetical protein QGG36_16455 [Pirellulaceae bacterium]|jgi:hypothetical protein|nr:hypothetical protein [Pirellulaceae bacterium]MDP7017398.1 hypothetical protein [Pirellulaceae bacterium]
MKTRGLLIVSSFALVCVATVFAAEGPNLKGVKCLMNPKAAAKAEKSVAFKNGKVFFCCDGCAGKFTKAKDKFTTRGNHQLVATGQYKQGKCPLTGRPLNDKQTVKVGTVEVKLCCGRCKAKVAEATGAKQAELVFSDAAFKKGAFAVAKVEKKK